MVVCTRFTLLHDKKSPGHVLAPFTLAQLGRQCPRAAALAVWTTTGLMGSKNEGFSAMNRLHFEGSRFRISVHRTSFQALAFVYVSTFLKY